jgi:hypothetical protein
MCITSFQSHQILSPIERIRIIKLSWRNRASWGIGLVLSKGTSREPIPDENVLSQGEHLNIDDESVLDSKESEDPELLGECAK